MGHAHTTVPDSALDTAWPLPTAKPWPPNHPQRPTAAPVAEPRILLLDDEPGDYIESVVWHFTTSTARPDAGIDVDLQTVDDGGTRVERGHWTGERWVYNESGGFAPDGSVRAWAYVEGPELPGAEG